MLAGASILALSSVAVAKDTVPAHPLFAVQPGLRPNIHKPTALPTWDFTWTYKSSKYTAIFVGTNPSSPSSTTVPVELIPVVMKYKTTTESPIKGGAKSADNLTINSPIFNATTNYTQGGTNVGTTQYEDAFERANLWGIGGNSSSYHVLLGTPTVQKKLTLQASSQATEFGVSVLLYPIGSFDNAIQATVKKQPVDSLPIFITTQTYLTTGGQCCIGGYHSYTGTQAYSMFTYIATKGKTVVFSQDVGALSHEVGEWMDDPETNNNSPCGIYEVGDPLERGEGGSHPYGLWNYTLNSFVYHLQDLAMPPYFGAPTTDSVNGWLTFQGYTGVTVCSNGS
jgi:hypothetical protein